MEDNPKNKEFAARELDIPEDTAKDLRILWVPLFLSPEDTNKLSLLSRLSGKYKYSFIGKTILKFWYTELRKEVLSEIEKYQEEERKKEISTLSPEEKAAKVARLLLEIQKLQ